MEEIQTTEEQKVLNWENQGEETLKKEETPKTFTEAEVADMIEAEKRKLASASEKWVQKVLKSKQNYEVALTELAYIADDNTHLINLAEDKPEVAKIILDKFYWGISLDDYKDQIGYEEDLSDPRVLEKKAEKLAEKKIQSKTISDKTNSFIDKLKMNENEKEKFLEAFEERKQLKSFNIDDIDKHLEKAYREISDNPLPKTQEIIAKTQATWEWKSDWPWPSKSNLDKSREEARDFLKSMWL